uniref:Retrovirus-related Pol polyprotein from transposon TNT 1-94-like beta-barrel domain-containing protein n=1 Tax=Cannabis sativa TaxID=3483 RepID=A0A803Q341_CANSA
MESLSTGQPVPPRAPSTNTALTQAAVERPNQMNNPFSHSLTSTLTVKLDPTNFLSWKSQVLPTVIGLDLDEILLAGIPPPAQLRFSSQSKARLLQLKNQFSTLGKGGQSISDFSDKVQSIADSLAIAGSPILDQDLILQLLNGFGPEYDSVVSGITARCVDLTLEEVQSLLLAHESRIDHHNTVVDLGMKLQANIAVSGSRNSPYRPPTTKNFTRGGYRGSTQQNRPLYQRCLRFGHIAPEVKYDPQAYASTFLPDFEDDSGWFVDTGATNHVTSATENLETTATYTGHEGLAVGDGKKLSISHIGSTSLQSFNSLPLKLNPVLHVPSITKNLK